MNIFDYAAIKYTRGRELESFQKRNSGYELKTSPGFFLDKLTGSGDWQYIAAGIRILGELEIFNEHVEGKLLAYAEELLKDQEIGVVCDGKYDVLESIIWVLGDIGTLDTLTFLKEYVHENPMHLKKAPNYSHILSASGYSYYHIYKREVDGFLKRINQISNVKPKSQSEINGLRKLNPKYAEYQQFLHDNFSKYSGGKLN